MQSEAHHPAILVIEDDPAASKLLRLLFLGEGYEVLLAENGDTALATLATVQPDLITLDLDLPGIKGDVVLNVLREQGDTKDVPVVVVSAQEGIPPEVQRQVQAIVRKPFEVDDLLAVVRQFLPPALESRARP